MVSPSKMWSWNSIISTFHVAVDLVQDVIFPRRKAHMLIILRKNSSEVAVVEVPCCNEYGVWLFGLVFADSVMQLALSASGVSSLWDVNSCHKRSTKLIRQVERSAFHRQQFNVRRTMFLDSLYILAPLFVYISTDAATSVFTRCKYEQ